MGCEEGRTRVSVHGVCVTNGLPSHHEPSVHIDAHSERTASVWGVHTITIHLGCSSMRGRLSRTGAEKKGAGREVGCRASRGRRGRRRRR